MARVTAFTADRSLEIENSTVVSGFVNEEGRLLLARRDGQTIDAGIVAGAPGAPGSGITDVEVTYLPSNSPTEEPTGQWSESIPVVPIGYYLWVRTLTTYTNPQNPDDYFVVTTYNVVRQGTPGIDGRGIQNSIIQYQEGLSGVNPPEGTWWPNPPEVTPGRFLWTKQTITYTDESTSVIYSVAKQGADGSKGDDGDSSHLHIAYANSADGVVDFSTTNPSGRSYMGVLVDDLIPDSTDPSDYVWTLIKGASGTGISSTVIRYQSGTSGTTVPTGAWSEAIPTVDPGHFLWTRTTVNFTDGASQTSYSIARQGDDGVAGDDGVGIATTTIRYQASSDGVTPPVGTWLADIPAVDPGDFLWTRITLSYTDTSSSVSYSVAKQGVVGADGIGVVELKTYYAIAASAPAKPTVSPPGSPWTDIEPSYSGDNLYTVVRTMFEDNTYLYSDVQLDSSYAAAHNAVEIAELKAAVWFTSTEPPGSTHKVYDLWFDTDDGYRMYFWTGSDWVPGQFGTNAIANGAIDIFHLEGTVGQVLDLTANGVVGSLVGNDADLAEQASIIKSDLENNVTTANSAMALADIANTRAANAFSLATSATSNTLLNSSRLNLIESGFMVDEHGGIVKSIDNLNQFMQRSTYTVMVQNGNEIVRWENRRMTIREVAVEVAQIGNHIFTSYNPVGGTKRTIVRPL